MKTFIIHILFITTAISLFSQFTSCKEATNETAPIEEVKQADNAVSLTTNQMKNTEIITSSLQQMEMSQLIQLKGKVEIMPEYTTTVSAPMSGFIRQIKWIPGMQVSKGQTIVRIENQNFIQLQQEYLSEKNAAHFAQIEYERQSVLAKGQASSDKALIAAEEKWKQHQLAARSVAEKLKLININPANLNADGMSSQIAIPAPVSGAITEVMVNAGKYCQEGDPLVQIINPSGSRLVMKAFEKDLSKIFVGQKLSAYTNETPSRKINGKVEYIVKNVNNEGFANIICTFDQGNANIIPGQYMNTAIESQNREAWAIQNDAIVRFEGKEYIFMQKENGEYTMENIETGNKVDNFTQIIDYKRYKDKKIVIEGAYTLLMKMKNIAE